ncbi:MAG TPA: amino acid adenylation domain-containing protein, partial [Thermoanaerobaculia bacterium]|nr:amino acid adenylation domain-containing protein [Thermoanaerobaculia bacterium]
MEQNEISSRLAGLSPAKRALLERRMRGEAQGPKAAGIGRRAGTGPAPLSFSQQRLWFLDQLEPGSPTYNLRVLLRLAGPLHREALARSFQEVVRRHEVLRTAFQVADGVPVQAVLPWLELALPAIDLTSLPEREREGESLRQALALADRSFDLAAPPLVRLALLDLGAGVHHLLVVMHHIVSDGWSTGVLVREVGALYNAFMADAPSPLAELPIQYGDFAVWQRGWLAGGVKEQHLGYWRERLAGVSAGLDLPTDRPRPAVQSFRGATHRFEVGTGLTEALTALARREGMTPFMVLAAGLFSLLSRLSGEADLTLGTPIANRNRPEVEGLIGFFVNTLVLRAEAGRPRDILALLHHVREVTLGAYAHQDLPFEELVAELHPDRDLSRTPLFQVALAYENAPPLGSALAGVELSPVELPVGSAKFDLAFILRGDGETLAGTLEYATDLYDGATAARLCDHWLRLLETAVADPALEPAAIALLSPAERHQLLREWNDTRAATEGEALLHQLFEARVDLQPGAEAAAWQGESLTYQQLEERSNRLANLLQRLGAGPESPVAVWMERSLDMVTALLGASKAGATYLPIDAGWPSDRAEAVLAGTGAAVVLTRQAHLPAVRELQWRLPRLGDAVCLDVDAPAPPPEPLDAAAVRGLFDVVADRAADWVNDWVAAAGFVSSYTGEAFAEADVLEYRDRVLALAEPWLTTGGADATGKRVLEIGAGSGLILWELAPRVGRTGRYVGVDPSPRTQERNRERAAREGHANVELPTGFAHEIADLAETPPESFDLVILASTVQFFPGLSYLEHVLELALSRLAPGGALVIADVMDPRRREDFRRSLAAWAAAHPGSAAASRAGDRTGEGRLYVDEDLFTDLFGGAAAVLHREQGFANELGFRYDVVIRKAGAASKAEPAQRRKRVWTGWHLAAASAARPLPVASPVDIAYVIHTSGSTGAPKGIVVQHRPAVELCRWINSTFHVGPGDRLLFITSPAFDLSVYDVFGVLAAGGAVHVASEEALRDPEELVRLLVEETVTIWDSAPAALQQLAPLLPAGGERPEARLRLVLLSGDWIPVPLPDVVRAAFPGARVISLGGATEATVWSNWFPIGEVDPRWPSIPYGRPITNARYHVLDRALQPCAIGVPGDLYIGGDCLCVGYARLPEMTAERFVPDPFAAEPGARLYGTGDRARYGRDGNLEFLGRVDQQVKVRGYRIELEEIEAVLARHPGVREAAVVAREDIPGDKRLVGYFVPMAEPGPSAAELRASLQQVMPDYMVPWTFVALERMPITANGKLDRKALPAPREVAEAGAAYEAPRTGLELAVAGVWQEVLRLPRVGLGDDFFELGGSSLLATQVISRIRQSCGVELPLRALFEARTLAEMAKRVESLQEGPALPATAAPPLTPAPRTGPLPLSFAQQRLWFLDQLVPGSPLYNIPGALRLTGALDPALLGGVLAEVARRHEVLRTTFRAEGGEPVQVIAAEPRLPLPVVDLAGLPAARRREERERRTAAEARLPFDLATGPLLRAALLRLAPGDHVVLITLHHIVADAWSMEVFSREIGALYGAWSREPSRRRLPSPLPELALQYADYAVWQRRWLAGDALEAELEYWRRQLAGAPRVLELPADRPRPAVQSYRGSWRPLALPAGLGAELTGRAQRRGATLFMALLGAFATVLGRYAAREDVVVGSPVAGRDRPEIEGLIGFFVNTLVLRVDLAGDPGFDGLLDRVRAMALDAFAHQSLPFERLVDELAPVRDPSHSPLFQVAFAFQTAPREPLRLRGLTMEPLHDDSGTAKVDLLLSLTEAGGEVSGLWEYSTDLFDEVTIDRWSGHLASVLAAVATEAGGEGRRLSELPLLAPAERHQLLSEWNDTRDAVDGEATLDRLFVTTAGQWPDRVAVSFEDHSVTYRELAARAGRLARTLRAMGVEPEVLVGICAEESIERTVGVVGTVLAGGAFLPLDPAHPAERLELMAEDARIRVLLTQEHLRPSLPAADAAVVCLDDYVRHRQEPVHRASFPGSLPGPWGPVPDNLSYVIYTSGSTGRPNGVQVSHRSAVHLLRQAARHTLADEGSRVLQLVSFSFDASVLETWLAFSTGGALCVIGQETRLSGAALAET